MTASRELRRFFVEFNTERALVVFGYAVSAAIVTLFGLDLLFGWPFMRASVLFSAASAVAGLGLGWMSHNAIRDLR